MAVFWDKKAPIPKVTGITINRGDGNKVLFVKEAPYDAKLGYTKPKRNTIGYVCDDDVKLMHPTNGYRLIFPDLWEKYFHEKVPAVYKRIGMYALMDAVNSTTGIKDIMDECFGTSKSDSIMDFVMYSLLFHTNAANNFEPGMRDQVLYGNSTSETYFSNLFSRKISYDQILTFRKKWARQCKEDGVEKVWLCIDGSNDDCECEGVEIAEKGHAKSLRNRKIVSFTYAVTEEGKPVTFYVYRGGLVDPRAMKDIVVFLKETGIKIRGVILDRGYCDSHALDYLISHSIPYVIMVKGNPAGYTSTVEKYGNKIKLNAKYLIHGTCLFGTQDKVQLFDGYEHEDYLTLFYDYKNGSDRVTALLKKLYREMDRMNDSLAKGTIPTPIKFFDKVLAISGDQKSLELNTDNLQSMIDEKGLYSIVASENLPPTQVHHLYEARNSSETEYMVVKSQLGYGKVRIHITLGVQSKFLVGFIASCVRYQLQEAAAYVNRTTNETIQEINQLSMTKIGDSYVPIQGIVGRQEDILKKLGSSTGILLQIAKDENDRLAGRKPTPRHRKTGPKASTSSKKNIDSSKKNASESSDAPSEAANGSKAKKKPGVPVGTKRGDTNKDGSTRKKPGVPKGYKRGAVNKDGSPRKKPGPKPKGNSKGVIE